MALVKHCRDNSPPQSQPARELIDISLANSFLRPRQVGTTTLALNFAERRPSISTSYRAVAASRTAFSPRTKLAPANDGEPTSSVPTWSAISR